MKVLLGDDPFDSHAYQYYLKLLALRKLTGPLVNAGLTKQLGRALSHDEFLSEVQRQFGERGFRMARKGVDASNSPNKLTDEELVIKAVLTAIIIGSEVYVLTRDANLLEQYFKLLTLIKEHYRSMLAAEQFAAKPDSIAFREMCVENDGIHVPEFVGPSFLEFRTTDAEFNPLPRKFHFANIYCVLLGGHGSSSKVTFTVFCAEKEIANVLKMEASTNGLNTDKLNGRNCVIRTAYLSPENHAVSVLIGEDTMLPVPVLGKIGINDFQNALFCNEVRTHISW